MRTKQKYITKPLQANASDQTWLIEQLVGELLASPFKPGLTININVKQSGNGNAMNVLSPQAMCSVKVGARLNAKTRVLQLERENAHLREELASLRQSLNSLN